jgi:TldD protein
MKKESGRDLRGWVLSIILTVIPQAWAVLPTNEKSDVLLSTMQQELQRAQSSLGKLDPAPYFLSYSVNDQSVSNVVGSQGALIGSTHVRGRSADVTVRIGTPALDNSHGNERKSAISSGVIPLEDNQDAIAHELWRLTYEEYRKASNSYVNVKTGTRVRVQEEDPSPDFSQEKPEAHADYTELAPPPEQKTLEKMARQYSSYLRQYPYILSSFAIVTAQRTRLHFASSEGSHVVVPNATIRVVVEAATKAADGMDLMRVETFQAENLEHLPPESEIARRVQKIATDLKALANAPLAEPFDGPALLSGRAAAVFFHEVLGHRIEGHRQRGEQEGQTFTKKVNQQVLPEFLQQVSRDSAGRTSMLLILATKSVPRRLLSTHAFPPASTTRGNN